MLSPSPTGVSRLIGSSMRSSSSLDPFLGEARLVGDLDRRRLAVELLGEHATGALDAAHLLGDVHRQSDRAALVGERAGDGLANPPGGVRRKLVAHRAVELLDGADEAEVALLDQVEQRDVRLRVVPRDRHDEAQVRLDQLALRLLVARVLTAGELALPGRREQGAVSDLADVQACSGSCVWIELLVEPGVLFLVLDLGWLRGRGGLDQLEMGSATSVSSSP